MPGVGPDATAAMQPFDSTLFARRSPLNLDRAVMAFAGVMILISVALVYFVSPKWLLFTAFIGLNMLQASFTGFCPAAMIFKKLGVQGGGCAFK